MKILKTLLTTTVLFSVAFSAGCQTNSPKTAAVQAPISCELPVSKDLPTATQETKNMLEERSCRAKLYAAYEKLLTIGQGDPKPSNQQIYGDFLRWSQQQGLISHKQKAQLYSRYFTQVFATLPSDHQMCYYCDGPGQEKLIYQVDNELQDKQLGLVKILNDKATYRKSSAIADSVKLRIEAACHACGDGK